MGQPSSSIPTSAQHSDTTSVSERRWVAVFLGLLLGIGLGIILMPGLSLERKLYMALHGICAQTHNIISGGVQFPLCARDSGMYLSYLATVAFVWIRGRGHAGRLPPWPISIGILILALLMAIDGINSTLAELGMAHAYTPRNDLRLLTGMGAGIGLALIVMLVINTALRRDVDYQLRVLGGWGELGMLLAIDGLIVLAILADTPFLAWPLALLVVIGVAGNLSAVLAMVFGLALGRGGQVTRLSQMAHPATIGLMLTLAVFIALGRYRIWGEIEGLIPPPILPQ